MTPTRKMKREALQETLEYRSRQEKLVANELIEEKLTQLETFVGHLRSTPHGRSELQQRSKRFGDCNRAAEETSAEYYARLRHWLDRC